MEKVTKPAQAWFQDTYCVLKQAIQPAEEAQAVTKKLLAHHLGYTATKHILNEDLIAQPTMLRSLASSVDRLFQGEPLAYVLGFVDFYHLRYQVNAHVLVPRRETEELVDWIVTHHPRVPQRILDMGTGSGCIAISLAKAYPASEVHALDISPQALEIAKANAMLHDAKVHFHQCNLLCDPVPAGPWDIIVSNPPYVCEKEKTTMLPTVLAYEPHEAIFVPDNNPMLFYRHIGELACKALATKGMLYMEINETYALEVTQVLTTKNFQKTSVHQDMQGKDR
ncbi:MAG: peptide chain release factor N(5)-glutamine methyltransferase, partial [Cytophagales bacterium]